VLDDDFSDCDASDWVDETGQGSVTTSSSIYHSSPCSMRIIAKPNPAPVIYHPLTKTLKDVFKAWCWCYVPTDDTCKLCLFDNNKNGYCAAGDSDYNLVYIAKRKNGSWYSLASTPQTVQDGTWFKLYFENINGNLKLIFTQGSTTVTLTATDTEFNTFTRCYLRRTSDTDLYYDDIHVEGNAII